MLPYWFSDSCFFCQGKSCEAEALNLSLYTSQSETGTCLPYDFPGSLNTLICHMWLDFHCSSEQKKFAYPMKTVIKYLISQKSHKELA